MIRSGKKLIKRVRNKINLKMVYWAYIDDIDEWRLVFISNDVKTKGPRKLFTHILDANNKAKKKEYIVPILGIFLSSHLGKMAEILKRIPLKTTVRIDNVLMYPKSLMKKKNKQ